MNRTALYEAHRAAAARMVDFAGWEMPILYAGIVEEHQHTRRSAGMFDVSHMGRLEFHGPDAEAVLQRGVTRNLSKLAAGRCGYAHVCHERGGVLDDVIVARYPDRWLMVCNASNRDKIVRHFAALLSGRRATMTDRTQETCMIAVQGPAAMGLLGGALPFALPADPQSLKRYGFFSGSILGVEYSLFRTGYTGEDGFELVVPAAAGRMVWDYLLGAAREDRLENRSHAEERRSGVVKPAGLGARDTLRLEAGMCLYGHELSEEVDPLSAGCGWCVDLSCDFVGAAALRKIAASGPLRRLVGLALEGRRIARPGAAVLADGASSGAAPVGAVTSGTFGPTVGKSIALAYVDSASASEGAVLTIDLGAGRVPARIVALPFYKR